MYNLATASEYDLPIELTNAETNEYMGCLPDGNKATDIKNKLKQTLVHILGRYADPNKYEIIFTHGRNHGVQVLTRILADTFMSRSQPKFLMPYGIIMQNIHPTIATIFENDVAMKRLKTLYIPTTLQNSWTGKDFVSKYINGNVIFLYCQLCTEYGWAFSYNELVAIVDLCYGAMIPIIMDISHLLISSRTVASLNIENIPILVGDFKYGFGPVGLGFLVISKQFIAGWDLSEKLSEHFSDVIFPLLIYIANKSILASSIITKSKEEIDHHNWALCNQFIKTIQSYVDFSIFTFSAFNIKDAKNMPTKYGIILLLDPNSDFNLSGFLSFFVIKNNKVIDGNSIQNGMMQHDMQVFMSRISPRQGFIYTTQKNIYNRLFEDDASIDQSLSCTLSIDISLNDISNIVKCLTDTIVTVS